MAAEGNQSVFRICLCNKFITQHEIVVAPVEKSYSVEQLRHRSSTPNTIVEEYALFIYIK